jgi:FixJ family two-component response regulator
MAQNGQSQDPTTIIVVDADTGLRQSLWFSLAAEGFAVHTYASGKELLGATELPDRGCLVVDYHLPDMNGLDLVAKLRSRQIGLPAILIGTNPSGPVRRRAEQAGIPMIEKPLLDDSLINGIIAALRRLAEHPPHQA